MKDTLRIVVPAPAVAPSDSIWMVAYAQMLSELRYARAYPLSYLRKVGLSQAEKQSIQESWTLGLDDELYAFEIEVEREARAA